MYLQFYANKISLSGSMFLGSTLFSQLWISYKKHNALAVKHESLVSLYRFTTTSD